jgi:hypothetical protein
LQDRVGGVWQVPAPLHVLGGWYVETLHDSPMQAVPAVHLRQAPAPSHMPSWPQVDVACCAHSLSGSVPPMIGRHRPSAAAVFAFEQAAQLPLHADSQQTPSTQEPVLHSPLLAQGAPWFLSGKQTALAQ